MQWEHLVIRINSGGILIYPPMDFSSELEWMKSAVPYADIDQTVFGPGNTSGAILGSHPIQWILLQRLKGGDGYVGWMIVQEMGKYGWEMFDVCNFFPRGGFSMINSDDDMLVYMRRPLGPPAA